MASKTATRVIGDVHGQLEMFQQAIDGVDDIVLLGDLVDRGPDSPGCLRLALDLLDEGRARMVRSNHDDKLFRALKGNKVMVGPKLEKTLTDLRAADDAEDLTGRFLKTFAGLPFVIEQGAYVMAHGAISASYFQQVDSESDAPRIAEHMALYGEVDGTVDERGKPVRYYNWVDRLPDGFTALVGHDRRDGDNVFVQTGERGGRAFFLDTGCGKGGPLSFIDIPAETCGQVAPPA